MGRLMGTLLPPIALLLLGLGIGVFIGHLRGTLTEKKVRFEHLRQTISEGMHALEAGDIEKALQKELELSRIQGSPDDWAQLGPEIAAFKNSLKKKKH